MSVKTSNLSAGRPSSKTTKAPTLASLADKASTVRVNFDVDRDAHTKLKIYAAKQGTTIKELLNAYVNSLPEV